jgi:hypothetical protein
MPLVFTLEDFLPTSPQLGGHMLHPIAATVRWLKGRLRRIQPKAMKPDLFPKVCHVWERLIDSEFELQNSADYAPHGWPPSMTLRDQGECIDDSQECDDDEIPFPSESGTEALVAHCLFKTYLAFDEAQGDGSDSGTDGGRARSFAETINYLLDEKEDETHPPHIAKEHVGALFAVIASSRLSDAERWLLGCGDPLSWGPEMGDDTALELAWHAVAEALELTHCAEVLIGKRVEPALKPVYDASYILGHDTLRIEFNGQTITLQNKHGGFYYLGHVLRKAEESDPFLDVVVLHKSYTNGLRRLAGAPVHGEFGTHEQEPAGNVHGMPVDAILDKKAIEDYQQRLREIDADLEAEKRMPNPAKRKELEKSRDFLIAELKASLTQKGTSKSFANSKDGKFKLSVGRKIERAIKAIEKKAPSLASHFSGAIQGIHSGKVRYERPEDGPFWDVNFPNSSRNRQSV